MVVTLSRLSHVRMWWKNARRPRKNFLYYMNIWYCEKCICFTSQAEYVSSFSKNTYCHLRNVYDECLFLKFLLFFFELLFRSFLMQIKYHEKFIQIFIIVQTINFYWWAIGRRSNVVIAIISDLPRYLAFTLTIWYRLSNLHIIFWLKITDSMPLKLRWFFHCHCWTSEKKVKVEKMLFPCRQKECKFIQQSTENAFRIRNEVQPTINAYRISVWWIRRIQSANPRAL